MRPWTIDADDIKQIDFDDRYLMRTTQIKDFLNEPTSKTIVIATKGYGKTFLIKAKRVLLHRQGVSRTFIPAHSLSDKPAGDINFDTSRLQLFQVERNWVTAWTLAIYLSILKTTNLLEKVTLTEAVSELASDKNLQTPYDHLSRILSFSRKDFFDATELAAGILAALVRDHAGPTDIFIDNVDEYFNKHIQDLAAPVASVGSLSPDIWHGAQIGLLQAAYQIHRHAHDVRIFASIRKEAYLKMLRKNDAMIQQYKGSSVLVAYSGDDLRAIVEANIKEESKDNLVATRSSDPLERFLGTKFIHHAYTGQQEQVFDYIRRHTLDRPRDFMTIGSCLSELDRSSRANESTLRRIINDTASEIADEYINEINPHLANGVIDAFLAFVPRNVLSRAELERAHGQYVASERFVEGSEHVFCAMYKAGLLGVLKLDSTSKCVRQHFASPGELIFAPDGILPESEYYLVHPILEGRICSRLGANASGYIDRVNIVGKDREWVSPPGLNDELSEDMCVLSGDIHGFSRYMTDDPATAARITIELRRIVTSCARRAGAFRGEVAGGDSILVIHQDARSTLKLAFDIHYALSELPERPQLRIAIDRGLIWRRRSKKGPFSGSPVRIAARIEPHVTPGQIWITHRVEDALGARSFFERSPVESMDAQELPYEAGRFNVRKSKPNAIGGGTDEDIWVQLWRVCFGKIGS